MKHNTADTAFEIIGALRSVPVDDAAEALTLALAVFGVLNRNKTHTLLEHFDHINSAYRTCFKRIQETGIENDLERLQTSKGHQEGHQK